MKLWLVHEAGGYYDGYIHAVIAESAENAVTIATALKRGTGDVWRIEGPVEVVAGAVLSGYWEE